MATGGVGGNMQIRSVGLGLALCALLLWSGGPAVADGPYLSLRGGVNFLQNTDMTIRIAGVGSLDADLFYETGWLAGGAGGYAWDNGFAIEGEFTFRQNGVDRETLMGGAIGLDGYERSYAVMINGYYRFDTGTLVTPYLGAGIGNAFLNIDAGPKGGQKFNDWDTEFA
jgi:opacity protein-like surface antigen